MPGRDFSGPRRVTPLSPLPPPLPSYPRNSSHYLTALTAGPSLCTHFPNPFHSLFLHIQAPFSFFMIFSPAFPGLWIVFTNFFFLLLGNILDCSEIERFFVRLEVSNCLSSLLSLEGKDFSGIKVSAWRCFLIPFTLKIGANGVRSCPKAHV